MAPKRNNGDNDKKNKNKIDETDSNYSDNYYMRKLTQFSRQPLSIQWRAALVRLPWLVPQSVLHFTSPEGPFPVVLQLPSRSSHTIPVHVFIPPTDKTSAAPRGDTNSQRQWPVHLDFHGGGFIMGSCLEQAPWCALLARQTRRVVISVDYRKGPFDQFPAAVEDAEDVLAAVLDAEQLTLPGRALHEFVNAEMSAVDEGSASILNKIDGQNISISGFSSGGNLALNLVLSVKCDDGKVWSTLFGADGPIIPLLLFYPSFDSTLLPHERPKPAKMQASSNPWFASIGSVLGPSYLPSEMRRHPRASPGLNRMDEALSKRARIFLVLPEIDSLAAQSEAWVSQMHEQGLNNILTIQREPDMHHGWTQFPDRFLDAKSRERKYAVFSQAIDFLQAQGS